jgi:DNA polymerase III delta prime subunit
MSSSQQIIAGVGNQLLTSHFDTYNGEMFLKPAADACIYQRFKHCENIRRGCVPDSWSRYNFPCGTCTSCIYYVVVVPCVPTVTVTPPQGACSVFSPIVNDVPESERPEIEIEFVAPSKSIKKMFKKLICTCNEAHGKRCPHARTTRLAQRAPVECRKRISSIACPLPEMPKKSVQQIVQQQRISMKLQERYHPSVEASFARAAIFHQNSQFNSPPVQVVQVKRHLECCGDVESNPGPTQYYVECMNDGFIYPVHYFDVNNQPHLSKKTEIKIKKRMPRNYDAEGYLIRTPIILGVPKKMRTTFMDQQQIEVPPLHVIEKSEVSRLPEEERKTAMPTSIKQVKSHSMISDSSSQLNAEIEVPVLYLSGKVPRQEEKRLVNLYWAKRDEEIRVQNALRRQRWLEKKLQKRLRIKQMKRMWKCMSQLRKIDISDNYNCVTDEDVIPELFEQVCLNEDPYVSDEDLEELMVVDHNYCVNDLRMNVMRLSARLVKLQNNEWMSAGTKYGCVYRVTEESLKDTKAKYEPHVGNMDSIQVSIYEHSENSDRDCAKCVVGYYYPELVDLLDVFTVYNDGVKIGINIADVIPVFGEFNLPLSGIVYSEEYGPLFYTNGPVFPMFVQCTASQLDRTEEHVVLCSPPIEGSEVYTFSINQVVTAFNNDSIMGFSESYMQKKMCDQVLLTISRFPNRGYRVPGMSQNHNPHEQEQKMEGNEDTLTIEVAHETKVEIPVIEDISTVGNAIKDIRIAFDNGVEIARFPKIENRLINLYNFSVTPATALGEVLVLTLPREIVRKLRGTPAYLPFCQYEYCRISGKIIIQSQTTQFQSGMLSCRMVWNKNRMNWATMGNQDNHVMLPGNFLNFSTQDALTLTFQQDMPLLWQFTLQNNYWPQLDNYSLVIELVSPMLVGSAGPNSAAFQVWAELLDCQFTGLRPYNEPFASNVVVPGMSVNTSTPQAVRMTTTESMSSTDKDRIGDRFGYNPERTDSAPFTYSDSMRIKDIISKPSIVSRFSLTAANTIGSVLFAWQVSPNNYQVYDGTAIGTAASFLTNPLFQLSQHFAYWRGDINVDIIAVATGLHKFQLRAGFLPNGPSPTVAAFDTELLRNTSNFSVYTYQGNNVFRYRIPWVSSRMFNRTHAYDSSEKFIPTIGTNPNVYLGYEATGTFYVTVDIPLQAPAVVAPTVNFLVQISAADNFELAEMMPPWYGATQTSSTGTFSPVFLDFAPASMEVFVGGELNETGRSLAKRAVHVFSGLAEISAPGWYSVANGPVTPTMVIPNSNVPNVQAYASLQFLLQSYYRKCRGTPKFLISISSNGAVKDIPYAVTYKPGKTSFNGWQIGTTPIVTSSASSIPPAVNAMFQSLLANNPGQIYYSSRNPTIWVDPPYKQRYEYGITGTQASTNIAFSDAMSSSVCGQLSVYVLSNTDALSCQIDVFQVFGDDQEFSMFMCSQNVHAIVNTVLGGGLPSLNVVQQPSAYGNWATDSWPAPTPAPSTVSTGMSLSYYYDSVEEGEVPGPAPGRGEWMVYPPLSFEEYLLVRAAKEATPNFLNGGQLGIFSNNYTFSPWLLYRDNRFMLPLPNVSLGDQAEYFHYRAVWNSQVLAYIVNTFPVCLGNFSCMTLVPRIYLTYGGIKREFDFVGSHMDNSGTGDVMSNIYILTPFGSSAFVDFWDGMDYQEACENWFAQVPMNFNGDISSWVFDIVPPSSVVHAVIATRISATQHRIRATFPIEGTFRVAETASGALSSVTYNVNRPVGGGYAILQPSLTVNTSVFDVYQSGNNIPVDLSAIVFTDEIVINYSGGVGDKSGNKIWFLHVSGSNAWLREQNNTLVAIGATTSGYYLVNQDGERAASGNVVIVQGALVDGVNVRSGQETIVNGPFVINTLPPGMPLFTNNIHLPQSMSDKITDSLTDNIQKVTQGIENLTSKIGGMISTVEGEVGSLGYQISEGFDAAALAERIMGVIVAMIQVYIHPSASTIAVAILDALLHLKFITFSFMVSLIAPLTSFLSNMFVQSTVRPEGFMDDMTDFYNAGGKDERAAMAALLVSGFFSTIGIPFAFGGAKIQKLGKILTCGISFQNFAKDTNSLISFFKNIVTLFEKAIKWFWYKQQPELKFTDYMKKHGQAYSQIIEDMQAIISPGVQQQLIVSPKLSAFVEYTREKAMYLLQLGMKATGPENAMPAGFLQLCNQVSKVALEVGKKKSQSQQGREPVCVYLYGPPGTGKSYAAYALALELMANAGIIYEGNPIWYRNPLNQYYNGYETQPCIIIDDYLFQSGEFALTQGGELMMLKSAGAFNAPQAAVEDKYKMCNPEFLIILANHGYNTPSEQIDRQALWRRRDIMARVDCVDPNRPMAKYYSKEERKDFAHLRFQRFTEDQLANVTLESEGMRQPYVSYREFMDSAKRDTRELHMKYNAEYIKRLGQSGQLSASRYVKNGQLAGVFREESVEPVQGYYKHTLEYLYRRCDEVAELCAPVSVVQHAAPYELTPEVLEIAQEVNVGDSIHVQDSDNITNTQELQSFVPLSQMTHSQQRNYIRQLIQQGHIAGGSQDTDEDLLDRADEFFNMSYADQVKEYGAEVIKQLKGEIPDEVFEDVQCNHHLINSDSVWDPARCGWRVQVTRYGKCCTVLVKDISSSCGNGCITIQQRRSIYNDYKKQNNIMAMFIDRCKVQPPLWNDMMPEDEVEDDVQQEVLTWKEATLKHCASVWNKVKDNRKTILFTLGAIGAILGVWGLTSLFTKERDEDQEQDEQVVKSLVGRPFKAELQNSGSVKTHNIARQKMKLTSPVRAQLQNSGSVKVTNTKLNRVRLTKPVNTSVVGESPQGYHILRQVQRNTVYCTVPARKDFENFKFAEQLMKTNGHIEKGQQIRALGICGHYMLVPKHFVCAVLKCKYNEIEQDSFKKMGSAVMLVQFVGLPDTAVPIPVALDSVKCFPVDAVDLCVLKLPDYTQAFKDIRKHMLSSKQSFPSRAMFYQVMFDAHAHDIGILDVKCKLQEATYSYPDSQGGEVFSRQCVTYDVRGDGYCGSLLISDNYELLSFHVSGDTRNGKGYGEVLGREIFQLLAVDQVNDRADSQAIGENPKLVFGGEFQRTGKIAKPIHQVTKTSIRPSLCQGILSEPIRVPAILGMESDVVGGYTQLAAGIEKQGDPAFIFPSSVVQEAEDNLFERIVQLAPPVLVRKDFKLTDEEMVCGSASVDFIDKLELSTSPGYPWIQLRDNKKLNPDGEKGKRWLIKTNDDGDYPTLEWIHPVLQRSVENMENQMKQGYISSAIYVDMLKDERLKQKKICKGGTRLINASPVHQTLVERKYCSAFFAAYHQSGFKTECGVGLNVHSLQWSNLYNYLLEVNADGDTAIAGDYSAFGPTVIAQIHQAAQNIIKRWYRHNYSELSERELCEMERVIDCLAQQLMYCQHVSGDAEYYTLSGVPSGNCFTAGYNSLANSLYMRCCWQVIMKEKCPVIYGLHNYNKFVRAVVYGDDLLAVVSKQEVFGKLRVIDVFNNKSLQEALHSVGLTYTDAKKNDNIVPFEHIKDVTFLKRAFSPHPTRVGVMLAPLEWDCVIDIPNFIKKCSNEEEASMIVCEAAIRELFHWEGERPGCMKRARNSMIKFWANYSQCFSAPTFDSIDMLFYDVVQDMSVTSKMLKQFISWSL